MKKVNVLGVNYNIRYSDKVQDEKLEGLCGYCDLDTKTIVIDATQNEDIIECTIRHELIHAFLYESGLDASSWARDEEIVDWIAIQFPKIQKAIKKVVKNRVQLFTK